MRLTHGVVILRGWCTQARGEIMRIINSRPGNVSAHDVTHEGRIPINDETKILVLQQKLNMLPDDARPTLEAYEVDLLLAYLPDPE